MFCPNCGNDCADANFCVKCGTRIQQQPVRQEKTEAWTVGMPCPKCGGVGLNGNCCAFCGVQLIAEEHKQTTPVQDAYSIPCQVYKGVSTSIALYIDGVIVETRPMFKKVSTTIRYEQITAVEYTRAEDKFAGLGFLTLRWEGNRDLPMPTGTNRNTDATTVVTSNQNDTLFYHIFYLLKAMAPASAQFSMKVPELAPINIDIDRDAFFERCSPYRALAVKDLCNNNVSIDLQTAKAFVDELFDSRQREQYEASPREAIKDLNKIVKYRQFGRT